MESYSWASAITDTQLETWNYIFNMAHEGQRSRAYSNAHVSLYTLCVSMNKTVYSLE